jgi:hypothetical protein
MRCLIAKTIKDVAPIFNTIKNIIPMIVNIYAYAINCSRQRSKTKVEIVLNSPVGILQKISTAATLQKKEIM